LLQAIASCDVDGEENGPSDAGADKHDHDGHLEETKEEEGIERLMLEGVGIWDGPEGFDPIEHAIGERNGTLSGGSTLAAVGAAWWRAIAKPEEYLLLAQRAQIGSRSIPSSMGLPQDQEEEDIDGSRWHGWHQGCNQPREGSIGDIFLGRVRHDDGQRSKIAFLIVNPLEIRSEATQMRKIEGKNDF